MKGIHFSTILLALVAVLLVVSVGMIGFVMFQMSKDTASTASAFWASKKWFLLAPTVMNVVSLAVLGALIVMG